MDEPGMTDELPYPMAVRLRSQGMADDLIIAELQQKGLSVSDAKFILQSMPGGKLAIRRTPERTMTNEMLATTDTSQSPGLPMTGILMLAAGIAITGVSYLSSAPGGAYLITWGLVIAGLARIIRGR